MDLSPDNVTPSRDMFYSIQMQIRNYSRLLSILKWVTWGEVISIYVGLLWVVDQLPAGTCMGLGLVG